MFRDLPSSIKPIYIELLALPNDLLLTRRGQHPMLLHRHPRSNSHHNQQLPGLQDHKSTSDSLRIHRKNAQLGRRSRRDRSVHGRRRAAPVHDAHV